MAQLIDVVNHGDTTYRSTTQFTQIGFTSQTKDGSRYTAVKASAVAIAVNSACKAADGSTGLSAIEVTTNTDDVLLGIADTAFAASEYGWLYTGGGPGVTVIAEAGVAAGDSLAPTAVNGELDTEGTSTLGAAGCVAITAYSGGTCTARMP